MKYSAKFLVKKSRTRETIKPFNVIPHLVSQFSKGLIKILDFSAPSELYLEKAFLFLETSA